MKKFRYVFIILFLTSLLPTENIQAGFCFLDPNIPDGETITYRSQSEGTTMVMREKITVVNDGKRQYYRITSSSPTLDKFIHINKPDMFVMFVRTVQKYDSATLDSTLQIIDQQQNTKNDEITVPHFVVLTHLLRGFPFESLKKLKIKYFGEPVKNEFDLSIKYKKREFIKNRGRTIECYKLELGLDGFWGTLLPELELWYTVAHPHYMVRYVGPEGPPGTPKRFIELLDYTVP